jgi:hypothetical protein
MKGTFKVASKKISYLAKYRTELFANVAVSELKG